MSEATDNVEAPEAAAEAPEATIERPEWLPEKFNTPEDLVNSYSALESKLGKGQEELRETIMAEIEGEAFANRPETAGDYSLPEVMKKMQKRLLPMRMFNGGQTLLGKMVLAKKSLKKVLLVCFLRGQT